MAHFTQPNVGMLEFNFPKTRYNRKPQSFRISSREENFQTIDQVKRVSVRKLFYLSTKYDFCVPTNKQNTKMQTINWDDSNQNGEIEEPKHSTQQFECIDIPQT